MRIIVLFDLPMLTLEEKREYMRFRKHLIRDGFVMMQKSVYTKIALNQTVVSGIKDRLRKNKPKQGLVQIIAITEKQFQSMEYIVGKDGSTTINSDKKLVIL